MIRGRRFTPRLGPVVVDGARWAGVRAGRAAVSWLPPAGIGALPRPLSDYKAPNYWLHYGSGFVRRGLPGEALRRLSAGPPTYRRVERVSVGLSRAAALSVLPMAVQVARRAGGSAPRCVSAALLLLSPLTCSLLLHDVGRYDGVGVLALASLASARTAWLRLPLPATVGVLGTATWIAAATEEFLLAVLAPSVVTVASLVARRRGLGRWGTALTLLGILGPGAVTAAASLLMPAPEEALDSARREAAKAGVEPAGAMGDALAALSRSFVENLAFFRLFEPRAVVLSFLLWAGIYAATTGLLGRLLGGGPAYRSSVVAHAVVGTVLSVAGVDFRRWWGLALVGVLSTAALQEETTPPPPVAAGVLAGAGALALAGLRAGDIRVHPWGPVRDDPAITAGA